MAGPLQTTMFNGVSDFYNGVITSSLKFNGSNSRLESPTFGGDEGDTWTWSAWVKFTNQAADKRGTLFGVAGNNASLYFDSSGQDFLSINDDGDVVRSTSRLLRDPSSWYHICLNGNGTLNKLWINGVLATFDTNANLGKINEAVVHYIGYSINSDYYFDGLIADVNFVDGTALDYSAFAEFKNGILIPIEPNVTYSDNGFRLQFKQTGTSANASGIGADTSGNNKHFTVTNFDAHDVLPDSPENNFCTLNPLILTPQTTFSTGYGSLFANLGATHKTVHGTFGMTTGKWYWEARAFDGGANKFTYGLTDTRNLSNVQVSGTNYLLANTAATYANGDAVSIYHDSLYKNGSATGSYNTAIGDNDIVGIAFDADAGKVWFHREGTWINGSATASTTINLSNHDTTVTTGQTYHIAFAGETSDWLLNAGQDSSFDGTETAQGNTDSNGIGDFYYSPPSGFLALCSSNLEEPTIGPNALTQAVNHFGTLTWTGNGTSDSSTNNIRSGGSGVGGEIDFKPDWTWVKCRSHGQNHNSYDSNRGAGIVLYPNLTNDEDDTSTYFTSFETNGFNLARAGGDTNLNNYTYVGWNWKANGGTTSSNTDGSITSTVQANTTAGFSIVTYTGNGTNGATIGHGLGVKPAMILFKNRDSTAGWATYHKELGATKLVYLNLTNPSTSSDAHVNNTEPTDTLITLHDHVISNASDAYVAYCFAEIEGYSKFGSFSGNSNADGAFVYTGFRPARVMIKNTNATSSGATWFIYDNVRDLVNVMTNELGATANTVEGSIDGNALMDFYSNGFKPRSNSYTNQASQIYMAFAEAPFKYANAR